MGNPQFVPLWLSDGNAPFEAHKCKGPVKGVKADGNRRAKSRGNRKHRARGDHACNTYKRGFWR